MRNWLDPEIIKPDPNKKYKCLNCTFSDTTFRYCVGYIERGIHMSGYKIHTPIGFQRVVAYERNVD